MAGKINFHSQDVTVPSIKRTKVRQWITEVVLSYGKLLGEVNYIFCSDAFILDMNKEYLKHDYYTDVITFDYCEQNIVSGDIYISIDTVKSNAKQFDQTYLRELHRVMVHGALHLCGIKDKSVKDAKIMRTAEDNALVKIDL